MLVVCFIGQYVKTGQYVVPVTKNFLEIHLFWAGKGTCCIPSKGYYGPAVSALSATPSTHLNLTLCSTFQTCSYTTAQSDILEY